MRFFSLDVLYAPRLPDLYFRWKSCVLYSRFYGICLHFETTAAVTWVEGLKPTLLLHFYPISAISDLTASEFSKLSHIQGLIVHQAAKFQFQFWSRVSTMHLYTIQRFSKIGQSATELQRLNRFHSDCHPPFWVYKMWIMTICGSQGSTSLTI